MRDTAKAAVLEKRHVRPIAQEVAEPAPPCAYLNGAKSFWEVYRMREGSLRRQALLAIFKANPTARLPVNNRWQANLVDSDLTYLLKRGVLRRERDGGRSGNPLSRRSNKRQTYLVLA